MQCLTCVTMMTTAATGAACVVQRVSSGDHQQHAVWLMLIHSLTRSDARSLESLAATGGEKQADEMRGLHRQTRSQFNFGFRVDGLASCFRSASRLASE